MPNPETINSGDLAAFQPEEPDELASFDAEIKGIAAKNKAAKFEEQMQSAGPEGQAILMTMAENKARAEAGKAVTNLPATALMGAWGFIRQAGERAVDLGATAHAAFAAENPMVAAIPALNANKTIPESPTMLEKGNVDLWNRKVLNNEDGSISTTVSKSFGIDGNEVLLPTVVDGKKLTDEEAIQHYRDTGEHMGKWPEGDYASAEQYASTVHGLQDQYVQDQGNPADLGKEESPSNVNIADFFPEFVSGVDEIEKAYREKIYIDGPGQFTAAAEQLFQFVVPFAIGLGAAGGLEKITSFSAFATNAVKLEAASALGAAFMEPHAARFADFVKELEPSGYLLNKWIDLAASDPNDTDAEGVFKNVLDNFFVSAPLTVVGEALVAYKPILQWGAKALRDVRNNMEARGPMVPGSPAAQRGSVGTGPPKRPYEGVLPPPKAGLTVAAADYTSSARTPMVGPERYAAERSLQKRIDSGEVKSSDYWARTPETEFEQALAAKIEESMGGKLVRTVRRKDPITGEAYFTNPPIEQISSKAIVMDLAKQMEPGMYDGKKMSVAQMAKQAGALVKDGSLMMPRPPGGDEIIESLMKKPQSGEPRRSAVTTALGERRTMKRMYGTMSFKLLRESWGKSIEALDTLLPKARKQVEADATKLLKEEYNVTDILGKNLKLQKNEKTAVGTRTEPLKVIDTDGVERGVEAVGMSLYQAYEEAGIKICAKAGVCKDGCLGLTSGSNFATGGGSDNAMMKGSRLAHFMATQAMLRDPEAFITVLQKQLRASAASAIANGNKPSVRLNMLSDLPPMVTEKLIKSNPDVMFYDYTKLDSDPIAPNHHLTYSSTGLTQTRYGVENKFQNWKFMQKRLEKSQNITMVFSGDTLPATVLDQETGKIYKVVDGDTHDYRPADAVAPGEPGVVVGLRNKDLNYKSKSIDQQVGGDGKDGKGFVVGYDPATDGTQYVVPKQPRPGFDTDGLKLGAYVLPAGLFLQQFPHLEDYYPDLVAEALENETEEAGS